MRLGGPTGCQVTPVANQPPGALHVAPARTGSFFLFPQKRKVTFTFQLLLFLNFWSRMKRAIPNLGMLGKWTNE
jgi:hypothetical protein